MLGVSNETPSAGGLSSGIKRVHQPGEGSIIFPKCGGKNVTAGLQSENAVGHQDNSGLQFRPTDSERGERDVISPLPDTSAVSICAQSPTQSPTDRVVEANLRTKH